MSIQDTGSTDVPVSLWQAALNQSASGITVYTAVRDTNGRIQTFRVKLANRRAEQFFGVSSQAVLEKTLDQLFPFPNQLKTFTTDIATVVEQGQALHRELFFSPNPTHSGAWFDLGIEPLGDGQSAVVSSTDITALKNAQQALLGESILFKTISSKVPDMSVVVVNYFQKILFANGELPGLYVSRSADEVLGKRIYDTILPEYQLDWKQYIGSALDGEQHTFNDHWGGWRCECYVGPVRNEQGDVVMVICVYRDISEAFRQQQTLQRMNNDLQQSNRSLEQFAYVASHDLQEPLRKIKSFGDLLSHQYAGHLDEAGQDIVHRMQSAADRMNALIRNLLTYARITTPAGLAHQQKQDLVSTQDILNDILADLDVIIHERNARIRSNMTLPMVPGDATQLRQLFQNLLTNAIKFTRPDQRPNVEINGQLVRGKEVPEFIGIDRANEYAQISVQDNGIGIAPENFDKIFGLFNRLHGRQQYAGSGIGLATCKRVVENHGGTIVVDSQPDQGTTFQVYLPMHVPEQIIP
ncbi:signal transduction histidine kinase [Spirosoma lacussanchae]|uniref:sensor histidine kinase n=1 Tax=Spirosoma lacussanchae TaxID=1884249 RepID=UPI001109ED40|nr:ATP-binding protein [Spirosoma lacussanchae]